MAATALGAVTVAAAGTPVQVTATETPANTVYFQIDPTNAGNIYIGTSAMNKTSLAGVFAILVPNKVYSWTASIQSGPNALQVHQFYLDADSSGEKAIVAYLQN